MKVFLAATALLLTVSCQDVETKPSLAEERSHLQHILDTLSYAETKMKVDSVRHALRNLYVHAKGSTKENILSEAQSYLVKIIGENLYYHWKGTPWDFNGITTIPKEGTIACGYFVTGLLLDAGYKLQRIKLSTCASSVMMKELTSAKDIRNLSRLSYNDFVAWIKNSGKGLYIVGLDFHTGFVINDGEQIWFIHSNYINKAGVIKEKATESAALKSSKTRYITCLTKNRKFLQNWLLN